MKPKKNPKIDLRNKRSLFFEIGMVIAISSVFVAFQYHTQEISSIILTPTITEIIPPELMPITRMEDLIPPEPPIPPVIKKIEVVDNTSKDDLVPDFTCENDPNRKVLIIPIPEEEVVDEPEFVYFAEKMPEFKGGMIALIEYLQNELTYPDEARINNVEGKVYVEFVVNKWGEIEKATIKKGVDASLDVEALRVINKMPKWIPGTQNLKKVSVCFTLPINFRLN